MTAEGRNFIKRSQEKYDIIMLNFVYTQSAREIVGYSLIENYIFTVEAFIEYLDHLTENGKLVIVAHNKLEVIKLFGTTITALTRRGESLSRAARHLISFAEREVQHLPSFALILKNSPFSKEESANLHTLVHLYGFQPIYFPYVHEEPLFRKLIEGEVSFKKWVSSLSFNAAPSTDNRPFFYNYEEKGVPSLLSSLLYTVIFLTLLVALIAWLSLKPLPRRKLASLKFVLYFLFLGLGFMFVEIAMIQKFILFLGQPTLTFSVLLFSLLMGSGIGSFFSGYLKRNLSRRVFLVGLFIAILILLYIFILPFIFDRFLGYNLVLRLFLSGVFMLPLGFGMGISFPVGLRILKQSFKRGIAWAWGINGMASVLGSTLAVAVAMSLGFSTVLALGASVYLSVAILSQLGPGS